jgi:hypothetical protein
VAGVRALEAFPVAQRPTVVVQANGLVILPLQHRREVDPHHDVERDDGHQDPDDPAQWDSEMSVGDGMKNV